MESLFEKYMDTVTKKPENKGKIFEGVKAEELYEDYGGESVERIITAIASQFFINGNAAINNGEPYLKNSYHYDAELAKMCKKAKNPEELKGIIIKYIRTKGKKYTNLTLQDLKWVKHGGWNHIFAEVNDDYGDTPVLSKEQEDAFLDNYHKRFK